MASCCALGSSSVGVLTLHQGRSSRSYRRRMVATSMAIAAFPRSYEELIAQTQQSTMAAIADGHRLIEVEFPTASLSSVSGDADGVREMNVSSALIRQFLRPFAKDNAEARGIRVFFPGVDIPDTAIHPDKAEVKVAREGTLLDPNAGSVQVDGIYEHAPYALDWLTDPNPLMELGLTWGKKPVAARCSPSDRLYVAAYPYFNVSEILAVDELYRFAKQHAIPLVVFNGELDRIRSGYYPRLLYPALGKLMDGDFLPGFEAAMFVHNFKGSKPAVLFRAYPGPWQVMRRAPDGTKTLVHEQAARPSVQDVARNILPLVL